MGTSCLYRSRAVPPEIILLPVGEISCTETLWTPVMVTRVVLKVLHYYAFCTIFWTSARPVYSTRDRSFARHTHHLANLFISKSTITSATDSLPPQAKAREVLLFLDSEIYTATYGYTGGSRGFASISRFFV